MGVDNQDIHAANLGQSKREPDCNKLKVQLH
jgi:hypothetical protein